MRRRLHWTIVLFLVCASQLLQAQVMQPTTGSRPLVFPSRSTAASINLPRVAAASKSGAAAFAKIAELSTKWGANIATQAADLDALKARFSAAGANVSDSQRAADAALLARAESELARVRRESQAEIQALQMKVERDFQQSVFPIVEAVGKEKGIFFVFSATAAGFVWFDDAVDITDEVIRRLDAMPPAKQ